MHMHARPFQNVDAAVPVPPRRRIYEAGSIEPVVDCTLPLGQVAVADPVRHPAEGVGVGWVGIIKNRREVLASLQVSHPYQPPSSKNLFYGARRTAHVLA